MPKTKEELSEKFDKYIREFGDVLTTDGNILYCRACNKVINRSFKKFSITQHFSTQTHIEAVDKYQNNFKTQIQIIDCNSAELEKQINKNVINNKINHNMNAMISNFQMNSMFGKRKDKLSLIEKYNNYIREFGDVLTTDGNILFCRACNREITRAFKKYSITQHFNTHSHIEAFKRFVDCDQQFIVCDQTQIKTEVNDIYVENSENTFVVDDRNDNNCINNNNFVNDFVNNDSNHNHIESDIKSHEKIILLLETIKDKVKLLLIDCKCELNSSLKTEVKQLINQYECNYCQLTEDRVDFRKESAVQMKNNYSREQQSSRSTIDTKKEFVFGNELFASKVVNLEPIVANSSFIIAQNVSKPESKPHINKVQNIKLKPFKCNKCGKCFANKRSIKSHIIIVHRNYNNKFINNPNLSVNNSKNNMNFNINNKKLKCDSPECCFQTKYNFEMKIHRISVHQNSAQKLSETLQKPIVEDNNELKELVKQEIQEFKCKWNGCGLQFLTENELSTHFLSDHLVKKSKPSERSESQSTDKSFITRHDSTRNRVLEKRFQCLWSECRKKFFTAARLKIHSMVKHSGEQPILKCKYYPKCQMIFDDRNHLLTHLSTYHESDQ